MPFVLGNFYPGHSEEVAGGKFFFLVRHPTHTYLWVKLSLISILFVFHQHGPAD